MAAYNHSEYTDDALNAAVFMGSNAFPLTRDALDGLMVAAKLENHAAFSLYEEMCCLDHRNDVIRQRHSTEYAGFISHLMTTGVIDSLAFSRWLTEHRNTPK